MKTIYSFLIILALIHWVPSAKIASAEDSMGTSTVEAVVELESGESHRLGYALEGSTLELGGSKCTLHQGSCQFQNVPSGAHIASILFQNVPKGVTYKFKGTNSGFLVRIKAGQNARLIYRVDVSGGKGLEAVASGETGAESAKNDGPKPDTSLKIEIWLRILNEEGPYERQASPEELAGTILMLGDFSCTVKDGVCVFPEMRSGKYSIDAKIKAPDQTKFTYRLIPETRPFEVSIDPWSFRPLVKGWSKEVVVMFEKREPTGDKAQTAVSY